MSFRRNEAVRLLAIACKIYLIKVLQNPYIQLQVYTSDPADEILLRENFGGRIYSLGRGRRMWMSTRRSEIGVAMAAILEYDSSRVDARLVLDWSNEEDRALRYNKAYKFYLWKSGATISDLPRSDGSTTPPDTIPRPC